MVGIQDWFNVYTGIRDNIANLQANLAATKNALEGISRQLSGADQGNVEQIQQDILKIRADLDKLTTPAKDLAEAFGPGELGIGLNIREQLSLLNQTHVILKNHLVPKETGGSPGNLSDSLTALTTAIKEGTLPSTDLADAVTLLVSELTKPGSPSTLEELGNFLRVIVKILSGQGGPELKDALARTIDQLRPIVDLVSLPFRVTVEKALEEFRKDLVDSRPADPSKALTVASGAITKAYQFGQAAHVIAVAAELFPTFKQLGFPQLAAALGDLAGFKEISGRVSGATIGAAITRPMRWWGNVTFRPEILTIRDLIELVQKRKIDLTRFAHGLYYQGFTDADADLLTQAVWREPTIRDLAIAIEDTTVPHGWLLQRVRWAGYEDADAEQLTQSLIQRSLKAARGRVISAALAAVTDGLLDTESYRTILESLQLRQDEIELQIRTAEISSRRDTVNTAIGTYKRQYLNDVIDRNDFVLTLTALGVNPDRVDLIALDADAQRAPKIAREEEAKLKASIREIQTELVPRYRRLYELGVIDDTAYENILIEAGISPQVAAQAVLLDRSKRKIVVQTATASALERETARLVAETEEALRLQYRKGLIDEAQLRNSLEDLGYSDERVGVIVNGERARLAPPPGKTIEAPAEAKARVLRDLAIQTALNDFRKGRIEALDLGDQLVAQGMTEDEALARVNLEISRLPVPSA